MKKKAISDFLICLGGILTGSALLLTGYNLWMDHRAEQNSQAALDVISRQLLENRESAKPADKPEETEAPAEPELPEPEETDVLPEEEITVPPEEETPSARPDELYRTMPETEIDGVRYIGYLEIPVLKLSLPVIAESTLEYLKIAPCRFSGTTYQNNLVIGAHNFISHFGAIDRLFYGNEVIFTDMDGEVTSYEVSDIEILLPNQAEYLSSGEWPLSLYTCTFDGEKRLTIRCDRMALQ